MADLDQPLRLRARAMLSSSTSKSMSESSPSSPRATDPKTITRTGLHPATTRSTMSEAHWLSVRPPIRALPSTSVREVIAILLHSGDGLASSYAGDVGTMPGCWSLVAGPWEVLAQSVNHRRLLGGREGKERRVDGVERAVGIVA